MSSNHMASTTSFFDQRMQMMQQRVHLHDDDDRRIYQDGSRSSTASSASSINNNPDEIVSVISAESSAPSYHSPSSSYYDNQLWHPHQQHEEEEDQLFMMTAKQRYSSFPYQVPHYNPGPFYNMDKNGNAFGYQPRTMIPGPCRFAATTTTHFKSPLSNMNDVIRNKNDSVGSDRNVTFNADKTPSLAPEPLLVTKTKNKRTIGRRSTRKNNTCTTLKIEGLKNIVIDNEYIDRYHDYVMKQWKAKQQIKQQTSMTKVPYINYASNKIKADGTQYYQTPLKKREYSMMEPISTTYYDISDGTATKTNIKKSKSDMVARKRKKYSYNNIQTHIESGNNMMAESNNEETYYIEDEFERALHRTMTDTTNNKETDKEDEDKAQLFVSSPKHSEGYNNDEHFFL